jgi:hypothetical protein
MELGYLSQVGLGIRDLDTLIIVPVRLLRDSNLKTSSLSPHEFDVQHTIRYLGSLT